MHTNRLLPHLTHPPKLPRWSQWSQILSVMVLQLFPSAAFCLFQVRRKTFGCTWMQRMQGVHSSAPSLDLCWTVSRCVQLFSFYKEIIYIEIYLCVYVYIYTQATISNFWPPQRDPTFQVSTCAVSVLLKDAFSVKLVVKYLPQHLWQEHWTPSSYIQLLYSSLQMA